MDHEFFKERIAAWLDKGLSAEEQHLLDEHIESCPECRELAERYKKLDAFAHRVADLSGDEDYWEQSAANIEARLGSEDKAGEEAEVTDVRRSSGFWWKIAGAAAAALLLTFIGLHQSDILDGIEKSQSQMAETRPVSPATIDDENETAPTDEADEAEQTKTADARQEAREAAKERAAEPEEKREVESAQIVEPKPEQIRQKNAIERAPATPDIESLRKHSAERLRNRKDPRKQPLVAQADSVGVLSHQDAVGESASASAVPAARDSLRYWKALMDSLSTLPTDGLVPRDMGIAYGSESDKHKAKGRRQSAAELAEPHERLLLAAYNVARLTDDRVEYQEAVEILRRYHQLGHELLSEQAEGYLRTVDDRFPDEP